MKFINIPFKLEISVIDEVGNFIIDLSITYEIRKSLDNSLISSGNLVLEGNLYAKEITITEKGQYRVIYNLPVGYESSSETIDVVDENDFKADLTELTEKVIKILKIESGKWKIMNNKMYFYDENGSTVLYSFDLKDKDGNPTETSVFERRPI